MNGVARKNLGRKPNDRDDHEPGQEPGTDETKTDAIETLDDYTVVIEY
ncbi:hypothetical protein [Halorhabdus sp. CBA1104]|nr:hypothetical protein [Halorhabdus sp. CBA1104]